MSTIPGSTLHVVLTPEAQRTGVPAGELLYAAAAEARRPGEAALLFGSSRDRDTAVQLGLADPWLARRPHGPFAARSLAATVRRALAHLIRQRPGEPISLTLWSRELDAIIPRLPRAVAIHRPALDRDGADPARADTAVSDLAARTLAELPSRAEARARLGLDGIPTLVPLAASPRHVDVRGIAFVSGVLDFLGHRHALVMPDEGQRFDEARRFIRRTEVETRVVVVAPPLLAALPAADVLIEPDPARTAGPARDTLRAIARGLGIETASTAGWDTTPGLGHGTLPPEIRATVEPAVRAVERLLVSTA